MKRIEKEAEWKSKEGFNCWVTLTELGHRCGYVEVDEDNLTNEICSYDDVPVEIHGGMTWGGNGKWGFDCAHCNDTADYWTLERVKEETNKLSEQLSKITWKDAVEYKLRYMPDWFKNKVTFAVEKEGEQ